MVLQQLQALLAKLYDTPCEHAVDDFLVTDRKQLPVGVATTADEQVFVAQARQEVRLGVYVAADVLQRLADNNPLQNLCDDNLSDYCTALEGVSHFHYLAWRAAQGRSVSLLELELQADVDKYAAALCLFTTQQSGRFPQALHERLFHRVSYDAQLDAESLRRYRTANRWAAKFCRRLDERFLRQRNCRPEAWLRELRRFYRLSHAQKMRFSAT